MSRVKRGSIARKHRKRILKFNKGFVGSHSSLFRTANQQSMRAFRYSYIDRRKRKNEMRKLWIKRLNSAAKINGFQYNQFICQLKKSKVQINRKILAQLSLVDYKAFVFLTKNI